MKLLQYKRKTSKVSEDITTAWAISCIFFNHVSMTAYFQLHFWQDAGLDIIKGLPATMQLEYWYSTRYF